MIRMWFLDRSGLPVLMDALEAIELMAVEGESYHKRRIVKQETIGAAEVSTVFIGGLVLSGRDRPLWETMIFGGTLDGRSTRYKTRGEAEAGHEQIAAIVRVEAGH